MKAKRYVITLAVAVTVIPALWAAVGTEGIIGTVTH